MDSLEQVWMARQQHPQEYLILQKQNVRRPSNEAVEVSARDDNTTLRRALSAFSISLPRQLCRKGTSMDTRNKSLQNDRAGFADAVRGNSVREAAAGDGEAVPLAFMV